MDSLTSRFNKEVFEPYRELLKTEYRFHPTFAHAKQMWEEKLTFKELVNGPYLEKSQIYAAGADIKSLPLHEKTIETIHKRLIGRGLYKHQTDALRLLLNGKNAVIATGTSSGKTLCYQIPILDDLIRDPSPGLRAIIIYPLNALVNDQLNEWEEMLKEHPQITFARFTGQTPLSQEEYETRLKEAEKEKLIAGGDRRTQQELEIEVGRRLREQLKNALPNRLNHREAIRKNPPHVLITNFSMLEYLLERPIDTPIFQNARLKFLVLDEAHAYRGVQATEIAFLIQRLKDRLGLDKLTAMATSATLGKQGDERSTKKVREFASALFGEDFDEPNPIYGTAADPVLEKPSFRPSAMQYIKAAESLRINHEADVSGELGANKAGLPLSSLLNHDENLYRLRKEILTKPKLLKDVAAELWPGDPLAVDGLLALLEIVAAARKDGAHDDLLPTRLHYFVRSQDGLHVCLHKECPNRQDGKPAFFVSRKNNTETFEGYCPACNKAGRISKLVEVVTCRKCGYLYGALQDLGPRRAQSQQEGNGSEDVPNPAFDSFSTELGWAADSFWSYFSVDEELPYPVQPNMDEDEEDQGDLFLNPYELDWCVICGKKKDEGAGDNCSCEKPHIRKIKMFHRQCPANKYDNLYNQEKRPLTSCPNCGARNSSGLEPVRRFQESDDETGLAMAIPLAHFQVTPSKNDSKLPRKLLCFTDQRQRAAAFPSLLEEETFAHDMGRKIVKLLSEAGSQGLKAVDLGLKLFETTKEFVGGNKNQLYDPDFFLPASRYPDELDPRDKETIERNLWVGEVLSYFGIPDAARESAEDLGLVAVSYQVREDQSMEFRSLISRYGLSTIDADIVLQVLLAFLRQRKAFTLPSGVNAYDPAFGRVTADISFALRSEGPNVKGWLPGNNRDNSVTDYLRRLFKLPYNEALSIAEEVWSFLTSSYLLKENRGTFKLYHDLIHIIKPESRFVCNRCGIVTAYSAKGCCPRKYCDGALEKKSFDPVQANFIARWVAGTGQPCFTTLKSEEHTAQINKDLAKKIEDEFKAEGVNLLSSTTTFEMGINIGDLQKVLLRNAPPTSASYVQRVGRAGRGKDKNSVCVTLCRRTKYDADAWNEPPRLMSGEVRTPAVFMQNEIIARRHFNAAVFARFLRSKIYEERLLGDLKQQQIRLAPFLPVNSRANIPTDWLKISPDNLFLDFSAWVAQCKETDIFQTKAGDRLLSAVSGFNNGRDAATNKYNEIIENISDELKALMEERKKLIVAGKDIRDIDYAVKNMLGSDIIAILAKLGFLPRYAFPLDVVTLETSKTLWSPDSDVELSRDRGIAIAEFAPGAQVIAHKKVFTSAGLYVLSKMDRPELRYYSKCRGCEQIRTGRTKAELERSCPVCQKAINPAQDIKRFVKPDAFSIRVSARKEGAALYRRSTLIRQRQTITHFIDPVSEESFIDTGLFRIALKEDGSLFRYNLGPGGKGFMLCQECGCGEPMRPGRPHKKLRVFSGNDNCSNTPLTNIAYGHEFQSYCLIVRPAIEPSVESLAFALQKGLCNTLDLETSDIGVSWRWLANRLKGPAGAEIVLYDNTPGGAGFVKEAFESWARVVENAHEVCDKCGCETACYDCLKNYGNQSYHERLDRKGVGEFLGMA
jgi:hypothetical protein